jgi:hypothetical protein
VGQTCQVVFLLWPGVLRQHGTHGSPPIASPRRNPSPSPTPRLPISTPTPPPSPPFSSRPNRSQSRCRSLVGLRPTSRRRRPIPPPTVSPSHSPSSYPLRLALAHLPDHFTPCNLQQDERTIASPKPSSAQGPPAASLSFIWTHSRTSIKRTRAPCHPEARRSHAVVQESPEARRRSTTCTPRWRTLAGTLT